MTSDEVETPLGVRGHHEARVPRDTGTIGQKFPHLLFTLGTFPGIFVKVVKPPPRPEFTKRPRVLVMSAPSSSRCDAVLDAVERFTPLNGCFVIANNAATCSVQCADLQLHQLALLFTGGFILATIELWFLINLMICVFFMACGLAPSALWCSCPILWPITFRVRRMLKQEKQDSYKGVDDNDVEML